MKASCWTLIMLLGQPCQGYKVAVTTMNKDPILLWSSVSLTCTIDPLPPGWITYVWYSSSPWTLRHNHQGPTTTVTIDSWIQKKSLYFCHVRSNGSEVAVGYTVIKPQGYLVPNGPTEVTYQYGDNVVLEVNISSSYSAASYINSLQWYKNGNALPVNCSSDTRLYTNTIGTRLTILRAERSDEGQYTVKLQNMQGVNNSYGCSKSVLSLLEAYYALHSPVTFTISPSSQQGGRDQSSAVPEFFAITTESIYVEKVLNIRKFLFQNCKEYNYHCPVPFIHSLFLNGAQLTDSRVVYTIQNGTLMLNISNAASSDLGVYEVLIHFCGETLYFDSSASYFRPVLGSFLWLYEIEPFIVQQYVPPQISLQVVPACVSYNTPITTITCTAFNGAPDVYNITLMKNGSVLETVVGGNILSYTVTWSGLGWYVCEVDSLYSTHQESIALKESAEMKLQLLPSENVIHLCQNESSYVQKMTAQLRHLTETLCSCTLSNDTFVQANVTCSFNNEPWRAMVSVWVQYASNNGFVTASDLISMIKNWLLDSACGCIAIEGSTLLLSRGCCYNDTNVQITSEQAMIGTLGGFFGGILLTIGLGACVVLSISVVRKACDSQNKMNAVKVGGRGGEGGSDVDGVGGNSTSTTIATKNMSEIEMEDNGAYETVRYGI